MAATSISVEQEQFSCPVCLDVLQDPVTIPCGHSYCMDCIEGYWNKDKQKGIFCCPQCRQTFSPRPTLSRSTVLAEVVEKFQGSGLRGTPLQPSAKTEDVVKCDICSSKKSKAVKSCLVCLESYCDAHLMAHEVQFCGKTHKLIQTLGSLKEKLCPHHNKLLRVYCRTDQQCVCTVCTKESHKDHDTVSVVAERKTQQKQLDEASLKSIHKCKEIEKKLKQIIRYIKHATETGMEESERVFSKLIRSVERRRSEVREEMRAQEKAAVGQAETQLEKLDRELAKLRKSDSELEQLSHTEDHIYFLQRCRSLDQPPQSVDLPCINVHPCFVDKILRGALVDLHDRLQEVCEKEIDRISDKIKEESPHQESNPQSTTTLQRANNSTTANTEPKTRSEFLQYCSDMVLDVNTANPYLRVSDGRKGATTLSESQLYPDNPERFTSWAQVLCRGPLTGRRYWEVEWEGSRGVSVGACYKGMTRTGGGSDSKLGHNSKSWSLDCSNLGCSFQHNKDSTAVGVPCSNRIGVFLDHGSGTLSFYSVSDKMTLLHRTKTTFTQPLYPGFWMGLGSTLKLGSPHKRVVWS
ncbi:tripartite motif-containing protein 16-like isoform X2 [Osmerus eperlanus]|uniref:tripartite motif-containing protein 16-like isoform X2 n=1 Tax=Osmerus eperlanus TaxID=29151 RepID=UPI002E1553EF